MSVIDLAVSPSDLRALAEQSNAWPFEQAKAIVARLKKSPKDEVLFETGYGPSGLPHIGTFGEVARTTMVRHAFRVLTEDKIKTRLLAFSDDMDGLRKVPDNVPNKELLEKHLGRPLTKVPDPFGTHDSFGAHNNARLRAFLDTFGFDYEFASSTDYYTSGKFDAALLRSDFVGRKFERRRHLRPDQLPGGRREHLGDRMPFRRHPGRRASHRGRPEGLRRQEAAHHLKMGRSAISKKAALSHTGTLAGSNAAYDAAFRGMGAIVVDNWEEVLETACFFECAESRKVRGRRHGELRRGGRHLRRQGRGVRRRDAGA